MQLRRYPHNPILKANPDVHWEANAVMNAAVLYEQRTFHMLYRALDTEIKHFPSGDRYNRSTVGYARSKDGIHFHRSHKPLIFPEYEWESLGCEDPRVTKLDDDYYIFYTAVAPGVDTDLSVQIAAAVTKDFTEVRKLGIITLDGRGKAAALFPEKINDKYVFLFTKDADTPQSTIFLSYLNSVSDLFDQEVWYQTEKIPLFTPAENAHRGPELGAVPIKTEHGWLFIFCPQSFAPEWSIGAALLDLENPTNILSQTDKPLLSPQEGYETEGYTPNVAFPSGAVVESDKLLVYYGGADQGVCLATSSYSRLLKYLRHLKQH